MPASGAAPKIQTELLSCRYQTRYSEAFYIGVLGSRETQEQRRQRLLAAGISEATSPGCMAPLALTFADKLPKKSPWP